MSKKSYNWQFMIPTIGLVSIDCILLSYIARNYILAIIAIFLVYVLIIFKVVTKFLEMPHKVSKYGKLEDATFDIPGNTNIKVFLSSEMGRFDFLGRVAELTSSIFQKEENKLILNQELLEKKGKRFMQMAGTREILKFNNKIYLKNYLGVILPILIASGLAFAYFAFASQLYERFPLPMLNFIFPFLLAILFVFSLFRWNSSISKRDSMLDKEMLNYYRLEEIEFFIKEEEKILSKGDPEKSRVFNDHFSKERISKLHISR